MLLVSPAVVEQMLPEDVRVDVSPVDVLRRQFQTYRPKAERYTVHLSLGRALVHTGQLSKAAMHFDEALDLAQNPQQQAEARYMFGAARLRQGRLQEAESLVDQAMAGADQDVGPLALHLLAEIKLARGHVKQALRLFNEAFDLAEQRQDFDGGALLAAALGEAWASNKGSATESAVWFETARQLLSSARASPAGESEAVAARVDSLHASSHRSLGRLSAATSLYSKALRWQTRQLSPMHPDLMASHIGLALARRDMGDLAGARADLEAVEQLLRAAPREGPQLSRLLIFKADVLRASQELAAARLAIQEAMALQAEMLAGEDHPDAGLAVSSYGSILHDAGELEAAQEQYQSALTMNMRLLGRKHARTAAAHSDLGSLFQDRGADEQARAHFAECVDSHLAVTSGHDTIGVAGALNNLATVLFRSGRPSEALPLLRRAVEAMDAAQLPSDHPDRVLYQENLDLVLEHESR